MHGLGMQNKMPDHRQSREHNHQVFFLSLVALLVVFIVWSFFLLLQVQELRRDFVRQMRWGEALQQLRADVEPWRSGDADTVQLTLPPMEQLKRQAAEALAGETEPLLAWQELQKTLADIDRTNPPLPSQDFIWQASTVALSAIDALEGGNQRRILSLYQRLNEHWTALLLLVFASLLLATSNLWLLRLAHRRRRELEEAHQEAVQLASHDALTGLWNRMSIRRLLGHELARGQRLKVPLGVVLADLDRFKEVNALLGQEQGDVILEQIGARLHSLVRPYDTLGRYSGDSFLLVLPSCDEAGAEAVAERWREAINEQDFEHAHGHRRVTLSLAYTTIHPEEKIDIDLLVRHLGETIDRSRSTGPGLLQRLRL